MNASATIRMIAPASKSAPPGDERSLLARFDLLLEREEKMVSSQDAAGLAVIADERALLVEQLAEAVRMRRARPSTNDAEEAELIELYRTLRQRHDLRIRAIRRRAERNAVALRVLAQAAGRTGLYQADGNVRRQFTTGPL